jgi:hypothetical protein
MDHKLSPKETGDALFTLGYLCAAAECARQGQDGLAEELMAHVGISKTKELNGRHLLPYDKKPLRRVLKLTNPENQ